MNKVSGSTFYVKKVVPVIWYGALLFFVIFASFTKDPPMSIYVVAIVAAIFSFVMLKKMVWDLADVVVDDGDNLRFIKGTKEQRVYLKDIVNINYSHMSSPERVVVQTSKSGDIGNELAFQTPWRLNFFSKSPEVEELIERVNRARNT